MRKAAPDILDELGTLGVDFSCVDDMDKLSRKLGETAVSAGPCDKMEFSPNGSELTANITSAGMVRCRYELGSACRRDALLS